MRQIDMSPEAVTLRLKLASELRRLCLSLGTAKVKPQSSAKTSEVKEHETSSGRPESRQPR